MSVLKQTNKQTNPYPLSSPLPNSTAEQNIPLATVLAVASLPSIMPTLSLLAVGGREGLDALQALLSTS